MPHYVIGDIQGCMDSLAALLKRIGFRASRDRLWLVGDLVNRGPRSVDVLRWAKAQGDSVVAVLGNHDIHLLARAAGADKRRSHDTLEEVLRAPDAGELIEWLRHRPLLWREGRLVLVHAGLLPDWTIDQAEDLAREVEAELRGPGWTTMLANRRKGPIGWASQTGTGRRNVVLSAMTTVRMLTPSGAMQRDFKGHPSEAPGGTIPWYDHPNRRTRKQRILFGHWAALGLLVRDDVAALDTGCVWGNHLTALCLDDGKIVQQRALEPAAED